jgi:choline dehydrogenase-like flavoprotein
MNSFDSIIIGGGLSGLLLAHRLHQGGHNVGLLEARESLGGRYRRQGSTARPYTSSGLDFYPASNENVNLLEWVKSISPVPLNFEVREHRPQLFDEGRWRPFAGFGETHFQSVAELALFSHTHDIAIEPGLEQLVRALVEQLPFEASTMSEVTGFKFAEDGRIAEVIVNGDKSVRAERVIFTPHATLLNNLIEGEALPAKHRTRLAKMQPWTAVVLELNHTPALVDDPSIRVFTHGSKEFEPVVGRVIGANSKWMTLVPGEREAEHEFIGQCIRHIKRQLKRAWPAALDGQLEEKIYVQANAFGQQSLKTKESLRFPEIANLFLGNHLLAARAGEIGSLEIVETLETAILGGAAPVKRSPESAAEEF